MTRVLLLLLLFFALMWFFFNFIMRWQRTKGHLTEEEKQRLITLQAQVNQLEQRVKVLETILDNKVPDWRKL